MICLKGAEMPKEFYTERDIEDMFKRGVMSLQVTDNVVLTELAYEKANRLGMQLLREKPLTPPAAPVRPYISQPSQPATAPAAAPAANPPVDADLAARIRAAVLAQLGNQVDPALLDVIIQRVLKSTGAK
jgi:hypothetical protein